MVRVLATTCQMCGFIWWCRFLVMTSNVNRCRTNFTTSCNCFVCGQSTIQQKNYNKVVLEPWVSPEHTSKYVDTVTVFAKPWTKGHWPLDDLWPHICCGHMCDSTQGSLCPSPMKIHQSMWIQWPFLQKKWTKGHWPLDDL